MKSGFATRWLIYGGAPVRMDEALLDLGRHGRAARDAASQVVPDPYIYLVSNRESWCTLEALEADQGFCRDTTLALRETLRGDGFRLLVEVPGRVAVSAP